MHAYWVEPGVLLAGEYPGQAVGLLVAHGVRTFVDLTSPSDGLPEYTRAAHQLGLGTTVLRFPIPDFGTLEPAGYDEIVAAINAAADRGAVYVHCWGGIGRTGTVVGCWLVDAGLTADAALARLASLRAGTRGGHRRSPETKAQVEVIRARAARQR